MYFPLYITFFQIKFTITLIRSVIINIITKYFQKALMSIVKSRVGKTSCWRPSQQANIQKPFQKCWLHSGFLVTPQELASTQSFENQDRVQDFELENVGAQDLFGRHCLRQRKNCAKPAACGFPLRWVGTCHGAAGISRIAERVTAS